MSAKLSILIIEDEKNICDFIAAALKNQDYRVFKSYSGMDGLSQITSRCPDILLLDLGLPDMDGTDIIREVRKWSAMPVIVISARTLENEKVLALDLGADDYITKPFNPRELTIRARNLLSRTMNLGTVSEERRSVESYKFNGWELDINSRSLIGPDGEQYKLPRSEFRAMLHFCENPGKIQSRAELLKKMTGRELKPHDRTVDVTIRRIRKHFESTPDTPEIIATIHGEGYRFCGDLED